MLAPVDAVWGGGHNRMLFIGNCCICVLVLSAIRVKSSPNAIFIHVIRDELRMTIFPGILEGSR